MVIKPMTKDFILWRCLHNGPLSQTTIDQMPATPDVPWPFFRARNIPLLEKLTRLYGACAVVAFSGRQIIGMVRFYPKVVWQMAGAGDLCLQQDHPAGPIEDFSGHDFPSRRDLKELTIKVHCMMTGSSGQQVNPYQRKGIGTRMIKVLIQWAKNNKWQHIEADSFEDLPLVYHITGDAGFTFWEKLGFHVDDRFPHPHLDGHDEFVMKLEGQARAAGINPDRARDQIVMRLDL